MFEAVGVDLWAAEAFPAHCSCRSSRRRARVKAAAKVGAVMGRSR